MTHLKTIALVLAFGAATTSCVNQRDHLRVINANEALKQQIGDLTRIQEQYGARNGELEKEIEGLRLRAMDASWIAEQKGKLKDLLDRYKPGGPLEIPGAIVYQTADGLSFQVQGEILFSSGQAILSKGGEETLKRIAEVLVQEGRRVRVEGHSDNDPIRRSKWKSNLELSTARAVAVAHLLTAHSVEKKQVMVAGFGPFRPAAPGDTDADKRRNRRVEIILLNQ